MCLLAACAGPIDRADEFAARDDWIKAVLEYRKALAREPKNIEYRSRLKQTELMAAGVYYMRGMRLLDQGRLDDALAEFEIGLMASPGDEKLQQARNAALARRQAQSLYLEGENLRAAGKAGDAAQQFRRALAEYPAHPQAAAALKELQQQEQERIADGMALTSKTPVTLNFRQTDIRMAFEFIARSFGVQIVFDEAVKSIPVTVFAREVTFEQGLNLLTSTTRSFYKKIGPNAILIAPDTKEKRSQYEDHLVATFSLNAIRAKEMADILKGVLSIRKIIVNEQMNSLIVRDTEDIIRLARRIVDANDRKPAEIMLDVEILEVNRTKAERLGLDLGSYAVSAAITSPTTVPVSGSISNSLKAAATLALTVPSLTFRFFKQDVDAKTLANPKIRTANGKPAKIHIGDRVPLRAATIQDATGQVRTTFDYRDVGIRLTVEPIVHLDNSSTVKLALEVSSLGENRGTPNEPAFAIGTRNAETIMVLRDGETAILGGLIRDAERNTRVKVPGLGDVPAAGALFTSYDDSTERTDVLLTITPRVVRGWDLPPKSALEFYSGTDSVYSDKPLFPELLAAAALPADGSSASTAPPAATNAAPLIPPTAAPAATPAPAAAAAAAAGPVVSFAQPLYEAAAGQPFDIQLVVNNLAGSVTEPLALLYNPQVLEFVRGSPGDIAAPRFSAEADAGVIRVDAAAGASSPAGADGPGGPAGTTPGGVIARITMRGAKPGVSYLTYRAPSVKTAAGATIHAQVQASRVVIK